MKRMIQVGRQTLDSDAHTRIYHTRSILTREPVEVGVKFQESPSTLIEEVLSIDGVLMAEVHPYYIAIVKGIMFDWKEIEPRIQLLLSSFSLPVENVVSVRRPDES